MSTFGGIYFTNKGRALQAKSLAGAKLNFTRIAVGDGNLNGQAAEDLSALIHEVKNIEITKLKAEQSGRVTIGGMLSNQSITSGFYWRELGLFAQDPDLGEILYCYSNAGNLAEYIPSPNGSDILEKRIDIVAIVGNAANVSASINSSLVYASASDLENSLSEAKSYTDSKVVTKTSELQNDSGFITVSAIPSSLPANGGNASTINNHTVSEVPNTAEKTDIIKMVNEVNDNLSSHKADSVSKSAPEITGEMNCNANTIGFTQTDNSTSGTAKTIDWRKSNKQKITIDNNTTLTFIPPSHACNLLLAVLQSGVGHTVILPTIKTSGGSGVTFSNTDAAIDILTMYFDGTNYYANVSNDWK